MKTFISFYRTNISVPYTRMKEWPGKVKARRVLGHGWSRYANSGGGENEHWVCSFGYTPIYIGAGLI